MHMKTGGAGDRIGTLKKFLEILLAVMVILMCVPAFSQVCMAEETDSDSLINQYDYSSIDQIITEYSDYHMSFQSMIKSIVGNGEQKFSVQGYISQVVSMLKANEAAMLQILIIGILSAVLKTFTIGIGNKQLTESSQIILSLTLITVLVAVFAGAVNTTTEVLSAMIQFYQAICPVFFPAMIMVGGQLSAAAYYQIVTMMIGVVDMVFKNVLIKINSIYMLLGIADSITEEDHYTKACELTEGIIKYVSRTVLVVFLGLNGMKSMITPFLDSEKNNILYRALSVIPGLGSTAMAVSKTMLGAGTIVKNSIGVAAILVIIILSLIPVMKLLVLVFLYKAIAAIIEPIAGKNVVSAVNFCSKAIGNLLQMLLVTLALLILTIGIICMTTNVNYGT